MRNYSSSVVVTAQLNNCDSGSLQQFEIIIAALFPMACFIGCDCDGMGFLLGARSVWNDFYFTFTHSANETLLRLYECANSIRRWLYEWVSEAANSTLHNVEKLLASSTKTTKVFTAYFTALKWDDGSIGVTPR